MADKVVPRRPVRRKVGAADGKQVRRRLDVRVRSSISQGCGCLW
jgi:hypothetical protein